MLLVTLFGAIQMVVARSAWDCSSGIEIAFWIGAGEAGLGFLVVTCRIISAAANGEGILAAFSLERLIIVVANEQGQVQQVGVIDRQQMQVIHQQLAAQRRADV